MVFWIRETAGWLLVLAGLYLYLACLASLEEKQIVEGVIRAGIATMIFRGGIHLIKVATAARVVLYAKRQ